MTFKNINFDKPMKVKLINPSIDVYLVDDIGNEYQYIPSLYPRPEDVGRFVGSSLTNLMM